MSIKPQFAQLIKSQKKTVELRRVAPKVEAGDVLVIYESSPVKRITACCEIEKIIVLEPEKLWEIVNSSSGLTRDDFFAYFNGKEKAVGIKIKNVRIAETQIALNIISERMKAPQSYRYLTEEQVRCLPSMCD